MFKSTKPLKDVEELIEHMVELVLIFHLNATSKCGELKKPSMLKEEMVKLDKSLKEKSQLDKPNDKQTHDFVALPI